MAEEDPNREIQEVERNVAVRRVVIFGAGLCCLLIGAEPIASYCTTFFGDRAPVFLTLYSFARAAFGLFVSPLLQLKFNTKTIYIACSIISTIALGLISLALIIEKFVGSNGLSKFLLLFNFIVVGCLISVEFCTYVRYLGSFRIPITQNQKLIHIFLFFYFLAAILANILLSVFEIFTESWVIMIIFTGINFLSLFFYIFMAPLPYTKLLSAKTYYKNVWRLKAHGPAWVTTLIFTAYYIIYGFFVAIFTTMLPSRLQGVLVGFAWAGFGITSAMATILIGIFLEKFTFRIASFTLLGFNIITVMTLYITMEIDIDSVARLVMYFITMAFMGAGTGSIDQMSFHVADLYVKKSQEEAETDPAREPIDKTALVQFSRFFSNGSWSVISLTSIVGYKFPYIYMLLVILTTGAMSVVLWQLDAQFPQRVVQALIQTPPPRVPGSRGPGSRSPGSRGPGSRGPGSRGPGSRGQDVADEHQDGGVVHAMGDMFDGGEHDVVMVELGLPTHVEQYASLPADVDRRADGYQGSSPTGFQSYGSSSMHHVMSPPTYTPSSSPTYPYTPYSATEGGARTATSGHASPVAADRGNRDGINADAGTIAGTPTDQQGQN